ncbi:MAG: branched-chain amino acid ABC transporter substrate-binding protein [Acidobacteriota bacterium]
MRKKTRILWGALGASALLLALLGCADKQVVLGVAAPLSGEQAKSGQDVVNGVQLAVDEWNAKGGIKGKKVVVLTGDDKGDPDQALVVARLFTKKAKAVVGHYNSPCTLAAIELYSKDKVPMVTPSSTNPDVTDRGYLTVFRVCGRDDQQGRSAAKYVVDHFPGAKVAVIHDKSSYGQDLANEFLKNFEFLTKTQSAFYGSIERTGVDIPAVVEKVKESGATVVYFGGLWPQGADLVKEMRQKGLTATFVSGDGCYDPQFLSAAGAAGEGTLVTFIPDQEKLPTAKAAVAAYKARYGNLGPYSLYAYTAAVVALTAMEKAGTTDGVEVARTLHKIEVETPFGRLKFDEKGDPQQSPYVMWKVEGGKYVEVPMDAPPAPAPAGPAG